MQQSKIIIINNKEFLKLQVLEKFRYCLIDPERYEASLTDQEHRHFENLTKAFQLTGAENSSTKAIKLIQNSIIGCEDWKTANRILRDCETLFQNFIERNKKVARMANAERLRFYEKKLKKEKKWLDAAIVNEKANKLEGLYEKDEQEFDWSQIEIPATIVTNDPAVLGEFVTAQIVEEDDDDDE
jgi:hypothetical protein